MDSAIFPTDRNEEHANFVDLKREFLANYPTFVPHKLTPMGAVERSIRLTVSFSTGQFLSIDFSVLPLSRTLSD